MARRAGHVRSRRAGSLPSRRRRRQLAAPSPAVADAGHMGVLDPEGQVRTVRLYRGVSERWVRDEAERPARECLSGQAVATRQPVIAGELTEDARVTRGACRLEGLRACVGVPLICGDRVAGVMAAVRTTHSFSPQEVDSLAPTGYLLGLALENARLAP